MATEGITRLAPSPTGALHLGNARTFFINHLLARHYGWRMLMRIEDLDGPRTKAGAAEQALDELSWLGLEWEQPIAYQSHRHLIYQQSLEQLIDTGAAYPCTCSRKDILLAGGAPHIEDGITSYPGTCRGKYKSLAHAEEKSSRPVAWRLHVPDEPITVEDQFFGTHQINLAKTTGDFVVFRNEGLASYQLAVVVDDYAAGVTEIVRGDDLLESAARQIYLRRLLGLDGQVRYWHLPLVVGEDGIRLAKRHGDTRIAHYRQLGATPQRVLGLLGYWSGLLRKRKKISLEDLLEKFDIEKLSHEKVVFTKKDDKFLSGK